jgi:hypothetical protein
MQRRYFSGNSARFVSGRILKRKVQITVHFDFRSNYAPVSANQPVLRSHLRAELKDRSSPPSDARRDCRDMSKAIQT